MRDFREYGIKAKLSAIGRIFCVDSCKGGVGKTTVASILSLVLKEENYSVGLLDLDFHGPTCHIVLGIPKFEYEEERGIKPYIHMGIKFASIYPFVEDKYIALRGRELSNAITEFVSIINWGKLDILIIDMPPGMGDTFLDTIRYMPMAEHIIVTTGSRLSTATVSRLIAYLLDQKYKVAGVIENMKIDEIGHAKNLAQQYGIKYLGAIPYDESIEEVMGKPKKLLETKVAEAIRKIARNIL